MNASIFDTNIYIKVNKKDFIELKNKENKSGWEAFANVWVIRELFAHLADKNDEDFNYCRRAIEKLHFHCFDDTASILRVVPEAKANLEDILGNMSSDRRVEIDNHVKYLAKLVCDVSACTQLGDIGDDVVIKCKEIADRNLKLKRNFVRQISQAYNNNQWNSTLLKELIIVVLGAGNISPENKAKADEFLTIPLGLLTSVLRKRAPDGLNEENKEHRNLLVDFDLIFAIKAVINNAPVHFVTTEGELLETVHTNFPEYKNRIMTLENYKNIL